MPVLRVVARRRPTSTSCVAAADGDRLPAVRQGRRRRRRARDAPGRRTGRSCASRARPRCGRREAAFGDPTVFLERAVIDPRHIEVQILADAAGNVDAPLRARLLAAAPPPEGHRDRPGAEPRPGAAATASAPTPSRSPATSATSTPAPWSSCVDERGQHVFIEMNPRIQVEHTVTEEVTDVDLVQRPAADRGGRDAGRAGPAAGRDRAHGAALQCRITTEDPANGFRPDTGVITAYRSPGGAGVRLDGGTARRAPRSARTSTRCWSSSPAAAATFATRRPPGPAGRRRVPDPRRGHEHAVPAAVLEDPDFRAGRVTTSFIESARTCSTARHSADRGTRMLTYLAEVTVNKPNGARPHAGRAGRASCRRSTCTARSPTGRGSSSPRSGRSGSPPGCARRTAVGRHRHHLPRRAPVPARHPGAHPGPGRRRARTSPGWPPSCCQPGVLGRRDLRRRAAVPRRGPVGAARRAARGRAQHLHCRCCCAAATPSATRRTRRR